MKKPIMELMYDIDKIICTKNMQEYGFIPNVGVNAVSTYYSEYSDIKHVVKAIIKK